MVGCDGDCGIVMCGYDECFLVVVGCVVGWYFSCMFVGWCGMGGFFLVIGGVLVCYGCCCWCVGI